MYPPAVAIDRRRFLRTALGATAAGAVPGCGRAERDGADAADAEAEAAPSDPTPVQASAGEPDSPPYDELAGDFPDWQLGDESSSTRTLLMFRGNPSHTFYGTGPLREKPELAWRKRLGDYDGVKADGTKFHWAGTGWTGQPVRWGGRVYVGSVDTTLYCFDAASGSICWKFEDAGMFKSSVCMYRGRLYVGNVDNNIRCIDAQTGALVWAYDTKRDCDSSPCVAGGWLYIGGEDGKLKCLNPDTGELRWELFYDEGVGAPRGSGGFESSPAVADGEVYIGHYDGLLVCADADTGETLWKAKTGADTDVSPVIVDELVYIAAEMDSPYLRAFDRSQKGKLVWEFESWRGFWSTPAVVGDRLYVGGHNGVMYCVDAKSGQEIWTFKAEASIWCSPAVVDGKVVFGSHDPYLYMLDAKDGALIWKYDVEGRVHSTPCIVDGTIHVGSTNGFFYCFA